jgi:hypothetical protein
MVSHNYWKAERLQNRRFALGSALSFWIVGYWPTMDATSTEIYGIDSEDAA